MLPGTVRLWPINYVYGVMEEIYLERPWRQFVYVCRKTRHMLQLCVWCCHTHPRSHTMPTSV